jgi:hypothetical protein
MPMALVSIYTSARAAPSRGSSAGGRDGRLRDMELGSANTIGLAAARDRALACRKRVYDA